MSLPRESHNPTTMTTTPTYPPPLEKIEEEARAAAAKYETVNDACPYSFYTVQGRTYRNAFMKAKLKQFITPAKVEGGAA